MELSAPALRLDLVRPFPTAGAVGHRKKPKSWGPESAGSELGRRFFVSPPFFPELRRDWFGAAPGEVDVLIILRSVQENARPTQPGSTQHEHSFSELHLGSLLDRIQRQGERDLWPRGVAQLFKPMVKASLP